MELGDVAARGQSRATFLRQKRRDALHAAEIGAVDHFASTLFLNDKTGLHQNPQVMGQCRWRKVQMVLYLTDDQPVLARPDKHPVNREPCGVAKSGKRGGGRFGGQGLCHAINITSFVVL